MRISKLFPLALPLLALFSTCKDEDLLQSTKVLYNIPEESSAHEGTWLQWPHHYQYGVDYRNGLDTTWIAMCRALETSENVHIIAYNEEEQSRIIALLIEAKVPLTNIDFYIYPTDDVWVRDNGPIYARDTAGALVIQDWGFNGWGKKKKDITGLPIAYTNCNLIPTKIAVDQSRTFIDLNTALINEGGSVEVDGQGTLMACKSSILNKNRNPNTSINEVESIFKKYYGATNFIWLDGQAGKELTDQHINNFARFGNATSIVTMSENDLSNYDVKKRDIDKLFAAKNSDGKAYTFVKVPLTKNNVVTTSGKKLGYKGSYVNYYIANNKVLVPNYDDPNDAVANSIIQSLYPNRMVVGIDVRNLYENGGMVRCVTQQQPKE